MERISQSTYATSNHITVVSSNPVSYYVKSENIQGKKYKIELHTDTMPSCTCQDFIRHKWPCKHMFAVMTLKEITWENLPEFFKNHPLINLDEECYSGTTSFIPHRASADVQALPKRTRVLKKKVSSKRTTKGSECRSVLQELISLTYELPTEPLLNLLAQLKGIKKQVDAQLNTSRMPVPPIPTLPSSNQHTKSSNLSKIPKRIKRKLSWTSRVGAWASMRKKGTHNGFVPSCTQDTGIFLLI